MPLQAVCVSHSPLIEHTHPQPAIAPAVMASLEVLKQGIARFDPELVVIFGPDHFAGFFYDLMPPFCVGARASAVGDFGISALGLSYNVPEDLAARCHASILSAGIDAAVSYRMMADHGFAQTLEQVAGGVGARPTIPIFINCAAPPLPTMARTIAIGRAVGDFLRTLGQRVLVIGSGGLSHDPPIPRMGQVPPEAEAFLIDGRNPSAERQAMKLRRNLDAAAALSEGTWEGRALNPAWDDQFMQTLIDGDWHAIEALGEDELLQIGGRGGQEVRTWVAAFAALGHDRPLLVHHRSYHDVPLWNAGFGAVHVSPLKASERLKRAMP